MKRILTASAAFALVLGTGIAFADNHEQEADDDLFPVCGFLAKNQDLECEQKYSNRHYVECAIGDKNKTVDKQLH